MDRSQFDESIRRLYRDSAAPFDIDAFRAGLGDRIAAREGRRQWDGEFRGGRPAAGARRSRWATWRPVVSFAAALAVVAAVLGFGINAAVQYAGGGKPVVVITDSTVVGGTSTTSAGATTTSPYVSTTTPEQALLAGQHQRYSRAHARAVEDLQGADFVWPPRLQTYVADSELAVTGKVVKVDSARWNTSDGQRPETAPYIQGPDGQQYQAFDYVTFYVAPDDVLKGSPRFGEPVAIMTYSLGGRETAPVEVGDEVLVLAQYDHRPAGTWKEDAYFLSEWDLGVYMKVGDEYLNIFDPRVTATPEAVRSFVWADAVKGPTGIDPGLISKVKSVDDVTGGLPQGSPLTAPVGFVPAALQTEFQAASPGEQLLYVGVANRGDDMNAVLDTKNFHGMYAEPGWGVDFDYFGASPEKFGPTTYPQGVVGEFVDVVPIPPTLDFYLRLRDPLSGQEFYARILLSGDEAQNLEYQGAHLRVFNLAADEQIGGDQDPAMREFLADHQLSDYLQPGDIVRVDFSAINSSSTGKWKVYVDERGVQVANALTVERFTGAAALLRLVRNEREPATQEPGARPTLPPSATAAPPVLGAGLAAGTPPEVYSVSQVTNGGYPWGVDAQVSGDRIVWCGYDGADNEIYTWTPADGIVKLTSNSREDGSPQASGDRVVWCGYDGADNEIYTWTPSDGTVKLTANSYADIDPQVSGDRVVWCGADVANRLDVFTWTPAGGTVQVTHGAYCDGGVRVSGDRLAWFDSAEAGVGLPSGIFTWTPSGGTMQLTAGPSGDQQVELSGDRIVWVGFPGGADPDSDIFTWTPQDGIVQVTINDLEDRYPVVSGDRIAWVASSSSSLSEIYSWTPGNGPEQITSNTREDMSPAVSGDRVVWEESDSNGSGLHICAWTPAGGTVQVTSDNREDSMPQVSGDRLVWYGSEGTKVNVFTAVAYAVTLPEMRSVQP